MTLFRPARIAAPGAALLLAMVLSACCSDAGRGGPVDRGPVPAFSDVAAAYNARVEHLDRLWAYTVIAFKSVDREGEQIDEQGEGHLQVIRPRRLYLTVGKVGEVGYQLGSNDARYWWIDARNRSASVGEHARFTPATAERAGLPVHPLDFVEVLGIVPLESDAPEVRWSEDGRSLLVRTPARFGSRLLVLDPGTYQPREIRLLDSGGEVVVTAQLGDPAPVVLPDASWPSVRTPSRIVISVPSTQTTITLWLSRIENRGSRINEKAFDLDVLLREYRVETVRSIDEDARSAPVGG